MISICIPIYNFDVRPLVRDLLYQTSLFKNLPIEIVLIDDASDINFQEINHELKNFVNFIQLDQNIGRSNIRNLFLKYTTQPYLLFLDCDGLIHHNPNFISNYLESTNQNLDVVCGGRIYSEKCPHKNVSLNWKYGNKVESPAIIRSFMSNNFLIKRRVFELILFDETIRYYGHEDTLFGIELIKNNIQIIIIDNSVFNAHLENNKTYLEKNISSLKNLNQLIKSNKIKVEEFQYIKLLNFYLQLEKYRLTFIYSKFYSVIKQHIYANLLSHNPNLTYFNLYKLGEFIRIKKESTTK